MPKKIADEVKAAALADWSAGLLTKQQVADKHGMSPSMVDLLIRAAGTQRFRREAPQADLSSHEDEIVALYGGGMSSPKIAERFGASAPGVRAVLARRGVSLKTLAEVGLDKHLLSPEREREFVARCEATMDVPSSSAEFGISVKYGYRLMERLGGRVRTHAEVVTRHSLWHEAFAEVTPEASYWVGFLMADGWVGVPSSRQPKIAMALGVADASSVAALRSYLRAGHKLKRRVDEKGHESIAIEVRSSRLAADLAKHGVVNLKTNREIASDALRMDRNFWAGFLDGDGCFNIAEPTKGPRRASVSICGSRMICEQWRDFVRAVMGIPMKTNPSPAGSIWQIAVSGPQAYAYCQQSHAGISTFMPRKKSDADSILSEFATKYGGNAKE